MLVNRALLQAGVEATGGHFGGDNREDLGLGLFAGCMFFFFLVRCHQLRAAPMLLVFPLFNRARFINVRFTLEEGASLVFDMPQTTIGPNHEVKRATETIGIFFPGTEHQPQAHYVFLILRTKYSTCLVPWSVTTADNSGG